MNPRLGVLIGAAIASAVAVVLAITPVTWLQDMLSTSGDDAATFLVRRYAASATAALAVAATCVARRVDARVAVLLALSTWFGVQAVTAWWGITSGMVSGFAWVAAIADPVLATWFLILSHKASR